MEKEIVTVYPDNKEVAAYRYAPTVLLIPSGKVYDTDQSIVTDSNGYRYKRHIIPEQSSYYEYRKI